LAARALPFVWVEETLAFLPRAEIVGRSRLKALDQDAQRGALLQAWSAVFGQFHTIFMPFAAFQARSDAPCVWWLLVDH